MNEDGIMNNKHGTLMSIERADFVRNVFFEHFILEEFFLYFLVYLFFGEEGRHQLLQTF